MKKTHSKIINYFLLFSFIFTVSVLISPQKLLAENASGETVASTTATSSTKVSPYSFIKERIKEIQQRMETGSKQNEQEKKSNTEIDARKQPLIDSVKKNVDDKGENKQIKEDKQEMRDSIKQKLNENSIRRINAYTERIIARFNAAVQRFEIMTERISSRIKKIERGGIDLSESKTLLQKTLNEISSTKTKINEISSKISLVTSSETPKKMFDDSKKIFESVNDSIKETHKMLVETIKSIKNGVGDKNDAAESEN